MIDLTKVNGSKTYLGVAVLVAVAAGKHFAPEAFADVNLLDIDSVEGQGFIAYMVWAFRSAMKKLEA